MLHKTSGIILHTTSYSDTSIIVKIYTSKFGLQSYIINGARGKRSKNKAAVFQPMALVEMVVSNSEKSSLQRISEVNVQHPYTTIPYNIAKSSIAIFLNELLYRSLKEQHPDEDLYEYISNSLLILDIQPGNCSNFHLCFLVQLSRFLGFYPQGNYTENTPYFDLREGRFTSSMPVHPDFISSKAGRLLDLVIRSGYDDLHRLTIDRLQRKELLQILILFYQLHILSFGEIHSLGILEEVIS